MVLENEDFIDFPFKQDYIDEDEIEYFSGDEIEGPISPHHFDIMPIQPDDSILQYDTDSYDFEDDDDDEYVPDDVYEDFFSDSDFLYESDDYDSQSGIEQAHFSESDNEDTTEVTESENVKANKESEENRTSTPKSQQLQSSSNPPASNTSTTNA